MERDDELPTGAQLLADVQEFLKDIASTEPIAEPIDSVTQQNMQESQDKYEIYDQDPKHELTDRLLVKIFHGIPSNQLDPRFAARYLIENLELFKRVLIRENSEKGDPNASPIVSTIESITLQDIADHTKIQSERYNLKVGRMEWNSKEQEEELRNRSDYYNKWLEVIEIAAHESEH